MVFKYIWKFFILMVSVIKNLTFWLGSKFLYKVHVYCVVALNTYFTYIHIYIYYVCTWELKRNFFYLKYKIGVSGWRPAKTFSRNKEEKTGTLSTG